MKITQQMDREFLRKAVLRFLSERFRLAFDVSQIMTMMGARRYIDFMIDVDDVAQSLAILIGLDLVEVVIDPLGATKYYKITARGILESERMES